MGKIYKLQESDVPNLYWAGFVGIFNTHLPMNKRDYYKKDSVFPPLSTIHHIDSNTGQIYMFIWPQDVNRYRIQFQSIKKDLDEATINFNIKPITKDSVAITKELGEIDNKISFDKYHKEQQSNFNKDVAVETFKNIGNSGSKIINDTLEPLKTTSEIAGTLTSSPSFLLAAAGAGLIALKVVLK